MPFDNVDALKDPAKYKAILKAELAKVKAQPVKFQYFENFPFTGKAGPLVIVGPYKDDFIDGVKNTGAAFKAKGRCLERQEKLVFSADQGTLKADKLNLALKVAGEEAQVADDLAALPQVQVAPTLGDDTGRAEVLGERRASGEVVDGPGGQKAATDTDRARSRLPSLAAAFDKLKSRFTGEEREKFRAELHAANELIKADKGAAALQKVNQIGTDLEKVAKLAHPGREQLPADAKGLASQANQAEKDIAAKEAEAETKWHAAQEKAQKSIDAAKIEFDKAKAVVDDLEKKKSNMRKKEFDLQKPKADTALTQASDALALRKLELAKLAKEPSVPQAVLKPLLERYAQLKAQLTLLEQRMAALAIDAAGEVPAAAPGKLADNPGLAQARDQLATPVGEQADLRAKIGAALKKQRAAITSLDTRWQKIAGQIASETGAQVDAQVLAELEKLRQARDALDQQQPVRDVAFDATFDADAQACARRINEAEKALEALRQAAQRLAPVAQRQAAFAQRAGQSGVQLAAAAHSELDQAEARLQALKQGLAQAPFALDSGAFDAALAQAAQRLDQAEPALQALEQALAQAAGPAQRFDQLAQRVPGIAGQALDPQARAERNTLEQRLQAARQAFGQSLVFDPQPVTAAQSALETRCSAGETALQQLQAALVPANAVVARFAPLEQRIDAAIDNGTLDVAARNLRTDCEDAIAAARRAVAQTLSFDAAALTQAQNALSAWIAARAQVLDQLEQRQLRNAYDNARLQAPNNAVLLRTKERLDKLLCAFAPPPATELIKLFKMLAPANDGERLDASKERDQLVTESKNWGKQAFTNALLKKVWASASKVGTTGGSGDSIEKCTLEEVELAIPLWVAQNANAVGVVSNLHVPGGGLPQYKYDKNPTRRVVECNFISLWAGKPVNVHVGITKANNHDLYQQNGHIAEATVTELVNAGRLNRS